MIAPRFARFPRILRSTPTGLASLAFSALLALAAAPAAADLEDQLQSRWHGAWIVTTAETRSDCGELYTNNTVHGTRTSGNGDYRLEPGELGQVHKIDVKRKRIDLLIDLVEPLRVSFVDGPFELFRHAQCRLELQYDVPRELVKNGSITTVEQTLTGVVERYDSRQRAEESERWNLRRVEPFPEGYDQLLAEYEAWKAEQVYVAIRSRLAQVLDEAARIADRARGGDAYGAGFVAGLRSRTHTTYTGGDCGSLVSRSYYPSSTPRPPSYGRPGDEEAWKAGYRDGEALSFHLDLARQLERCLP